MYQILDLRRPLYADMGSLEEDGTVLHCHDEEHILPVPCYRLRWSEMGFILL